jgi:hypothetical protein
MKISRIGFDHACIPIENTILMTHRLLALVADVALGHSLVQRAELDKVTGNRALAADVACSSSSASVLNMRMHIKPGGGPLQAFSGQFWMRWPWTHENRAAAVNRWNVNNAKEYR